jgi:hypothetical protein
VTKARVFRGVHVPSGLIDQEDRVELRFDRDCNFGEVQVHGVDIAAGEHERRALALLGTDRAEDIGGCRSLIAGR